MKTIRFIIRMAYVALFPIIVWRTEPFNGGDGAVLAWIYIMALSFPLGLVAAYLIGGLTIATNGTVFGDWMQNSVWSFWLQVEVCCLAGYLQWFVFLPSIVHRFRRGLFVTKRDHDASLR